jgi:hypothetical protein
MQFHGLPRSDDPPMNPEQSTCTGTRLRATGSGIGHGRGDLKVPAQLQEDVRSGNAVLALFRADSSTEDAVQLAPGST